MLSIELSSIQWRFFRAQVLFSHVLSLFPDQFAQETKLCWSWLFKYYQLHLILLTYAKFHWFSANYELLMSHTYTQTHKIQRKRFSAAVFSCCVCVSVCGNFAWCLPLFMICPPPSPNITQADRRKPIQPKCNLRNKRRINTFMSRWLCVCVLCAKCLGKHTRNQSK